MPADDSPAPADGAETLVSLPEDLRHELKTPLGPVETDAATMLEAVGEPLVTVGDVVTYHVLETGRRPDVAFVDERTKRSLVDEEVREAVAAETELEVRNPPAALTEEVVRALATALEREAPTTVLVDGEEDLVALPAILAVPDGASVVYGQPDEGMVHVAVGDEERATVRDLLERFDGDVDRLFALLE